MSRAVKLRSKLKLKNLRGVCVSSISRAPIEFPATGRVKTRDLKRKWRFTGIAPENFLVGIFKDIAGVRIMCDFMVKISMKLLIF